MKEILFFFLLPSSFLLFSALAGAAALFLSSGLYL